MLNKVTFDWKSGVQIQKFVTLPIRVVLVTTIRFSDNKNAGKTSKRAKKKNLLKWHRVVFFNRVLKVAGELLNKKAVRFM